jgi:hypothetical protein
MLNDLAQQSFEYTKQIKYIETLNNPTNRSALIQLRKLNNDGSYYGAVSTSKKGSSSFLGGSRSPTDEGRYQAKVNLYGDPKIVVKRGDSNRRSMDPVSMTKKTSLPDIQVRNDSKLTSLEVDFPYGTSSIRSQLSKNISSIMYD